MSYSAARPSHPMRLRTPLGVSFPIHELVLIRSWAEGAGLSIRVALDQKRAGQEIEELVVIRAPGRPRPLASLWRVAGGIVAQKSGMQPKIYRELGSAIAHLNARAASVAPRRGLWKSLTGWV